MAHMNKLGNREKRENSENRTVLCVVCLLFFLLHRKYYLIYNYMLTVLIKVAIVQ